MPSSVVPTLPTASGLDRALKCSGSMVLPRVNQEGSKAATRGTVIHRFIEEARTIGRPAALANIEDDELRQQAAVVDLESLPVGAESELAIAYSPGTGEARRLELKGAREYPDMPGFLMGTGDLLGVADEYVVALDFKTGLQTVSAKQSSQLKFLALAAAVLAEKKKARVALLFLNENGSWRRDEAEFDMKELGEFANELREMMGRAEAAANDVNEGRVPPLATGPHCRYCKSVTFCPAQAGLVRSLVPTLGDINSAIVNMTPEERGVAYLKYKQAEDLMKQIGSAFTVMAEADPIPLPGGMLLKRTMSSRSTASKDAAAFILERFNAQTLLGCVTVDLKVLSTQIRAALVENNLVESKTFPVLRQVKDRAK